MTKDDAQAAIGWIDDVMFYAVAGGNPDPENFKRRSHAPIQTIRAALLFTASTFIDNENIKASDGQVDPVKVSAQQAKAETVDLEELKKQITDEIIEEYNITRKTK